jgi:hypothetical protein
MEPRAADIWFAGISPTSHTLEHRSGFQKLQIAPPACRISETILAAGTSSTRNPL